jgi:Phage integrase family
VQGGLYESGAAESSAPQQVVVEVSALEVNVLHEARLPRESRSTGLAQLLFCALDVDRGRAVVDNAGNQPGSSHTVDRFADRGHLTLCNDVLEVPVREPDHKGVWCDVRPPAMQMPLLSMRETELCVRAVSVSPLERWENVELLDRRLHVRQAFVRNEMTTPKSKAGRRFVDFGVIAAAALEEQFAASLHRAPESIVFCHPALGTSLDPSRLTTYARKALTRSGVDESFRPWHGLRHTALTETAAAGVPGMFVQAKAGHAQGSTTERYLHAHRTSYPDARRACGGSSLRLRGTKFGARFTDWATKRKKSPGNRAPRTGLEPVTLRLTAGCSTN